MVGTKVLRFTIPIPPSATAANVAKGQHWSKVYKARHAYRARVWPDIHQTMVREGFHRFSGAVSITLCVSRARMDLDNVVSGWKAVQDELVMREVLIGDTAKLIRELHIYYVGGVSSRKMEVEIRELPEAD